MNSSSIRSFFRSIDPKPAMKRVIKKRHFRDFYSQFIKPGDLCFDIGTNIGNRTEIFAKLGAKVIALEPQPSCLEILKSKFSTNRNIIIVPCAVGRKAGTADMFISDSSSAVSTLSRSWIDKTNKSGRFDDQSWNTTISVSLLTLDDLIRQYGDPAFVKIDVEGFELEVIAGLTKKINYVSFEFCDEMVDESIECIQHLAGIGKCELNISYGETLEFDSTVWFSAEDMVKYLRSSRLKENSNGDIYVRFVK